MKDDVAIPARPPHKRKQLEAALDKWLAVWAADSSLTPSEYRRVQDERDRRKQAAPEQVVGVVEGFGGATPLQVDALRALLATQHPSLIVHPLCSRKVHRICRDAEGSLSVVDGASTAGMARETARQSDVLIGLVSETSMPTAKTGLWEALRYGKDRGADVKIIWPDGTLLEGRW